MAALITHSLRNEALTRDIRPASVRRLRSPRGIPGTWQGRHDVYLQHTPKRFFAEPASRRIDNRELDQVLDPAH